MRRPRSHTSIPKQSMELPEKRFVLLKESSSARRKLYGQLLKEYLKLAQRNGMIPQAIRDWAKMKAASGVKRALRNFHNTKQKISQAIEAPMPRTLRETQKELQRLEEETNMRYRAYCSWSRSRLNDAAERLQQRKREALPKVIPEIERELELINRARAEKGAGPEYTGPPFSGGRVGLPEKPQRRGPSKRRSE